MRRVPPHVLFGRQHKPFWLHSMKYIVGTIHQWLWAWITGELLWRTESLKFKNHLTVNGDTFVRKTTRQTLSREVSNRDSCRKYLFNGRDQVHWQHNMKNMPKDTSKVKLQAAVSTSVKNDNFVFETVHSILSYRASHQMVFYFGLLYILSDTVFDKRMWSL